MRNRRRCAPYEAIVFAGLVNPSDDLWGKANEYVEAGGKLIVLPGANELLTDGDDKPPPGYNNQLLPGPLKNWITTGEDTPITWAWDALKAHPLLTDSGSGSMTRNMGWRIKKTVPKLGAIGKWSLATSYR